MAYTKQTWVNGDVITDDKLNHMEDGIANAGGGGVFVIKVTDDEDTSTITLDKTFKEINDAFLAGSACVTEYKSGNDTYYYTVKCVGISDRYIVFDTNENNYNYTTFDENGYPSYYYGD